MSQERWQQIRDLFDIAKEMEPDARTAWLAAANGDEMVRAEVRKLLAALEQAGEFIERPAAFSLVNLPMEATEVTTAGRRIGPYQTLREIGRGGMGVVWLATRADDAYQKQVAIKLVWPGPESGEVLRRFRQERQILANLEHPNIARMLDGGTTEEGWPYVVMEYIEGQPITHYCTAHQPSLNERLQLFRTVCDAVQYAHQNLVVHRDLKPSNILVTEAGTVKLLDFGIAKLLNPDLSPDDSAATRTGLHLMTPEYASPEQLKEEPLGTTSDVYSLGLILYELLTGQRAYQVKHLSLTEILHVVCEETPKRPSTVVRHTAQIESDPIADKLAQQLRGDLDTIILTALQKSPEQRYASVGQLSEEIERHLLGLPVQSHQNTFRYRAGKFLRRNKQYVVAVCLLLLTLFGGILATLRQASIANELAQSRHRLLYSAQMNLASQAWQTNNVSRVQELLAAHIPTAGEEDLRGFEWYYLWRLLLQNGEQMKFVHPRGVMSGAISPDGTGIATGCEDGIVRLWEAATGKQIAEFRGHSDLVRHVSFSPDGSKLVSSSTDKTARIWDVQQARELVTLKGHLDYVNRASFSPDGKTIASCSDDGSWKLWEVETGKELRAVKSHANLTRAIAFSPDGKIIATGGKAAPVKLWEAKTGREILFAGSQEKWQSWSVEFSPDGSKIAAGGINSVVKVWDVQTGLELAVFPIDANYVHGVAFSPDSKQLAATSDKRVVVIWDVEARRQIAALKGHANSVYSVVFSATGDKVLTSALDNTARLWNLQPLLGDTTQASANETIEVTGFSPDYQRYVKGDKQNSVLLCDLASKQVVKRFVGHQGYITKIIFSPDGQKIASGGVEGQIKLWDVVTGTESFSLNGHAGEITAIGFSPHSKLLASGGSDNTLRIWNIKTGQLQFTTPLLARFINKIAFSSDSQIVATGSFDNKCYVWNVKDGALLHVLSGHQRPITSIAFSSDGKLLATGSEDDTVKIWSLPAGNLATTINELLGHVTSLTFSPDNQRLVIGSHDGYVSLWDLVARLEVLTSKHHSNIVLLTAFSSDGKTLITGDRTGVVRYWRTARP